MRPPAKRTSTPPSATKFATRVVIAPAIRPMSDRIRTETCLSSASEIVPLRQIGVRRQRALQIIDAGQQRLLVLQIGGARPARPCAASTRCRAGARRRPNPALAMTSRSVSLRTSSGSLIVVSGHALAVREVERRARQRLAVARPARRTLPVARAVAAGADTVSAKPCGRVALRASAPAARLPCGVGIERQVADLRKRLRRLGGVAAVEPVAEPQDFRRAREVHFLAARRRACARSGAQGCGTSSRALRAALPASSRVTSGARSAGRRHDGDRAARARRACQRIGRSAAARAFQACAAVQSLSMKRTSGPLPSGFGRLADAGTGKRQDDRAPPPKGAAPAARAACAPAFLRGSRAPAAGAAAERSRAAARAASRAAATRSPAARPALPGSTGVAKLSAPKRFMRSRPAYRQRRAAQIGIERDQRRLRPLVGAVGEMAPAHAPRQRAHRFAMRARSAPDRPCARFPRGPGFRSRAWPSASKRVRPVKGKSSSAGSTMLDEMARSARHGRAASSSASMSPSGDRKSLSQTNCAFLVTRRVGRQRGVAGREHRSAHGRCA